MNFSSLPSNIPIHVKKNIITIKIENQIGILSNRMEIFESTLQSKTIDIISISQIPP